MERNVSNDTGDVILSVSDLRCCVWSLVQMFNNESLDYTSSPSVS